MNSSHRHSPSRPLATIALLAASLVPTLASAATPQEKVLYSFQGGNDGANPVSDLVADKSGNLYATTTYGGTGLCTDADGFVIGCGTVFELMKPAKLGGKWAETVLYSFQGNVYSYGDSGYPLAGLVFDAVGNLYGTTSGNTVQSNDNGTIFELSPPAINGGAWTKTTIYAFQGGYDGANPRAGLIFDRKGNLYGSTSNGAPLTGGTVFRLAPPAQSGGSWTETILYTFTGGTDGQNPAGVTLDAKGNVFGTTSGGGNFGIGDQYGPSWSGGGIVFELTPSGNRGNAWSEAMLFDFPTCYYYDPENGVYCGTTSVPQSSLIADSSGNLYATTQLGGAIAVCQDFQGIFGIGCGTVVQFGPPAVTGGAWTQNTIYTFAVSSNLDGAFPVGKLTLDGAGNLYGTTTEGCIVYDAYTACYPYYTVGSGSVFELSPSTQGGAWTETILYQFQGGSDGAIPSAGLLPLGNTLYSTTQYGGTGNCVHTLSQPSGCGTVFEIIH